MDDFLKDEGLEKDAT